MTITSGIFNSVNGDRKYDAQFFAQYFASFVGNGVFPNPSTGLQVIANQNMQTVVKAGKGWINGYYINNDSNYVLQHDVADGLLKRIDRVVMRLNYLTRQIEIVIKKGTNASSPIAPALQRDTDYVELALADVLITNGATVISQANITDHRLNTSLCGIVHGTVNQVDTTTIFNQYVAWYTQFTVQSETNMDNLTYDLQSIFEDWMNREKNSFELWLGQLGNLLDGNVAANLANQITQHKDDYTKHVPYVVDSGTENSKIVTLNPTPIAYVEGMALSFKNKMQNTGAVTINVNGLGSKSIVKSNGNTLTSGSLKANSIYTVRYNGSNFQLQGEGGEYGTAIASDVLNGKSFGTESGIVNGTMTNRGSTNITSSLIADITIPKGYYDGTGKVLIPEAEAGDRRIWSTEQNHILPVGTEFVGNLVVSPEIKKKGRYRIGFTVQVNGSNTANVGVYVNGFARSLTGTVQGATSQTIRVDLSLNIGDVVQFRGYGTNSSTLNSYLVNPWIGVHDFIYI